MLEKKELVPSPLANAYASLKQSTKVKQARTILLKTIATRREIDLNSTKKKKMVGEILGPKILGHLCLLIEFTPPQKLNFLLSLWQEVVLQPWSEPTEVK